MSVNRILPMRRRKLLRRSNSDVMPHTTATDDNLGCCQLSASTSIGVYCEVSFISENFSGGLISSIFVGVLGRARSSIQLLRRPVFDERLKMNS